MPGRSMLGYSRRARAVSVDTVSGAWKQSLDGFGLAGWLAAPRTYHRYVIHCVVADTCLGRYPTGSETTTVITVRCDRVVARSAVRWTEGWIRRCGTLSTPACARTLSLRTTEPPSLGMDALKGRARPWWCESK